MSRLTRKMMGKVILPMIPMEINTREDLENWHEVRRQYDAMVIKLAEYEDREEEYKEILMPFMNDLKSELQGFKREFDFDFAIKNLIKRYENQKESLKFWREKYPNEF